MKILNKYSQQKVELKIYPGDTFSYKDVLYIAIRKNEWLFAKDTSLKEFLLSVNLETGEMNFFNMGELNTDDFYKLPNSAFIADVNEWNIVHKSKFISPT